MCCKNPKDRVEDDIVGVDSSATDDSRTSFDVGVVRHVIANRVLVVKSIDDANVGELIFGTHEEPDTGYNSDFKPARIGFEYRVESERRLVVYCDVYDRPGFA